MLEPKTASPYLSFKAWVQEDNTSLQPLTPEQQALQSYLVIQAAQEQARIMVDSEVEGTIQAVYERLGIQEASISSTANSEKVKVPQSWWERLGFADLVAQPMWVASTAMLVIAGVSTALILHYRPGSEALVVAEAELTRSVSVSTTPNSHVVDAPMYELQVLDLEVAANDLKRNLVAAHFDVKVEDLGSDGKVLTIHAPNAPFAPSTQEILQYYQLNKWITAPNTRIRLHLKLVSH